MFNVRLAGGHLYGKQLFTWLSLVVSFMASYVLSFFPLDVLDGIWDLIESVSEGFLTYSCIQKACLNLFLIGSLHQSSPMIRTLSYSFGLGIIVYKFNPTEVLHLWFSPIKQVRCNKLHSVMPP